MSADIQRRRRERKRGRRLVRLKEAMRRLGVRHTQFYTNFVHTGRLTVLALGEKARAVDEDELDAVIAALPVATLRPVPSLAKRKRAEAR